jgi:hypothetical protein
MSNKSPTPEDKKTRQQIRKDNNKDMSNKDIRSTDGLTAHI